LTSEAPTRDPGRTEHVDANGGPSLQPTHGERELVIEVAPHNCFACGSLNEHGLHLDLHVDGDRCWTETEFADRFQGWDGIAHGGIVATLLDEAMAWSLAATNNWGVTARMSIAFRKPIPIGRRIRAEGWMTARRRRVIDTAARIVDVATGDVLATGEATYVAADDERKAQLQARYRFRLVADPAAGRGSGA
jgi:acyl-coenzyme A thioesterase PaaI-like protein